MIAAYHEVDNIGALMERLPPSLCGLAARAIVVIDGEEDGTAAIVRKAGQLAVVAPVNRGQGAALRLGYRVAREHGAKYIVTADGDGQGDPDDLERVLAPVVAGEADFVNGSRRLGATESDDKVRNTGVLVYARLISLLAGERVTDTANPIRAMHSALSASFTLDEPQYQASELLISAIASGARFRERPGHDAGTRLGRLEEGRQPRLRLPLRQGRAAHLVARATDGRPHAVAANARELPPARTRPQLDVEKSAQVAFSPWRTV